MPILAVCKSTPEVKIVDSSTWKAFADDLSVTQMNELVPNRVQNIVGKGENAGCQYFLLFL